MSGNVERRLGDTLARHADELGRGPRFSAEDIVHAGRVALRRRRAARIATAAIGVAVLVVAGAVAAAGGNDRRLPAGPPNLTPTPTPSTSAPSTSVPSASAPAGLSTAELRLDVLSGSVILRPDGRRVTLALPAGVSIDAATRVPAGWVLATHNASGAGDSSALWLAPDAGPVQRIVTPADSYRVSADGRVLVVAGGRLAGGTLPAVTAYEMPSLRLLAQTGFDSGMGPLVAGISGDQVVLNGAQGSPGPSETAVWNLRTGSLRRTSQSIWTWGMSRDGKVLRRVDQYGPGGAKDVTAGCIDVVTVGDSLPTGQTGLCATWIAQSEGRGQLSPNGTWAVLSTTTPATPQPAIVFVRTTDLHSGQWRPVAVNLPAGSNPQFWDTEGTVIFSGGFGSSADYRCATDGSCVPVAMPSDLVEPRLVPPPGS